MDNKHIGKCKLCNQYYCIECSTNMNWKEFCSVECEVEFKEHEAQDNE